MAPKSILEEAMSDAKLLKETAIENAKNVLVEAISPKIKEFVEAQLGAPDAGMLPQPVEGMYEEHDDGEEDLALLQQLGLGDEKNEEEGEKEDDTEEEDEEMKETPMPVAPVQEAEEAEKDKEEKEEEEVVEITNEDLKSALSEVLNSLKEATVTKSFGDAQDATIPASGGPGAKGIADEKSGEHQWADEEAAAAQDWTVKEVAMKKEIANLKKEVKEYKEACTFLKRNLQEVNLFNSKLLYTNKLLHGAELNNKQRLGIIEAFDRAQSLREVELVYKSVSESLKIAGVLGEGKQVQKSIKGPKASRTTTPSSTVLSESVKKEGTDSFAARLQELAGLID